LSNLDKLGQVERANKNGVSRQTQIKIDRLARDFHDLHEEVKAGKLSVHRASIQAGFVRERTVLDKLQRLWTKASQQERARYHDSIVGS
jgi:methylphosphotriester-DNA--protein-cysteine methyltransferase